jgi:hypothetical protein
MTDHLLFLLFLILEPLHCPLVRASGAHLFPLAARAPSIHAEQMPVNLAPRFLQSVLLFHHVPFSLTPAQNFEISRCHGSEMRKRNMEAEIKSKYAF